MVVFCCFTQGEHTKEEPNENEKKMQSIPTACLNWIKGGGEGGVGEREIVMVSCFLTLEITLHRMNFASLFFTTL